MNAFAGLAIYLCIGTIGGLLGTKLRIPGGVLVGALLFVILFKLLFEINWQIPRQFGFVLQVFLGVVVGATFQAEMVKVLGKVIVPVMTSTLVLVGSGVILSIIFTRLNLLDIGTAYLGTSPGAMSALIVLAIDSGTNATLVTCFHFFRVVFIILTTPFLFKYLFH